MDMHIKPVKRKCLVRGCRNIGSYHISRRREFGYSVLICEDCLRAALAEIDKLKAASEPEKTKAPARSKKKESGDNGTGEKNKEHA